MVAPAAMRLRTVSVRAERSCEKCLPPSEKESGVTLRMAMIAQRWEMRGYVGGGHWYWFWRRK
ncbi:hypothetical protein GB937_008430 [Aspergillus fischeri]|nr:hypothetical protein GB937_008430 [Aspergillus fischeri]